MDDNEEMVDEMKIVAGSKLTRRILSSALTKAINNVIPIGLNLDIDAFIVDTKPDGTLECRLAAKGTADKTRIFSLIDHKRRTP